MWKEIWFLYNTLIYDFYGNICEIVICDNKWLKRLVNSESHTSNITGMNVRYNDGQNSFTKVSRRSSENKKFINNNFPKKVDKNNV